MTILPQNDAIVRATEAMLPLVVDLDGTLLKVDTLYELFAAGLFTNPIQTILSLFELRKGIAAFKRRLAGLAHLDVEMLPVREELLDYLKREDTAGREIHLATAADQTVALRVAQRFPFFRTIHGTDHGVNLKGINKAERLAQVFPGGFVYAGDSRADIPVWKSAKAAITVSEDPSLCDAVRNAGVPVERSFDLTSRQKSFWIKAIRPHQWAKNVVVLVPVLLGWHDVTLASFATTLALIVLLCAVASLTYIVNDIADLSSDRKHWSKRRRPFASGAIEVRDGLLVVALMLPIFCLFALLISVPAGICLLLYVAVTLGYSFGWKRIPLFDTFVIALLFTIRIIIGITASSVTPSAWLLTFSMFFFFSLALAKRHTEILRAVEHNMRSLQGRGYQIGDESLTLVFGAAASMASIVIVVIYLVDEVFARQLYGTPAWLWVAPIAIFLFSCRIWVLSHRGRMTDDPVAFALRDRVSLGLGLLVAIAILLAL
ncbi:UbiA family prenyltransferase [Streptomyces sp. AcH 505]|uniref:UbiA family prenyltransferase n=1 Tax=Streptomyces sp. AcH 505 TaxID=352211 RepID=UPI0005A89232